MKFNRVLTLGHGDSDSQNRTKDVKTDEGCDFSFMPLSSEILEGLKMSNFNRPSPVQLKALPVGKLGMDMVVQAKSGTGKTLVFTILSLDTVLLSIPSTQVLIMAPTREIALQIRQTIEAVGRKLRAPKRKRTMKDEINGAINRKPGLNVGLFIGGLELKDDLTYLRRNPCHIAVGTPGRICQLVKQNALKLTSVRLFVLDEADKLMDQSFQMHINWLFSQLPDSKQVAVFSATYPRQLDKFLERYMRSPTLIAADIWDHTNGEINATNSKPEEASSSKTKYETQLEGIKQYLLVCDCEGNGSSSPEDIYDDEDDRVFEAKLRALTRLLGLVQFSQCLVFCNYQDKCENLAEALSNTLGYPALAISSKIDQAKRNNIIKKLKQYQLRLLVSTDLTARGIDAQHINIVVNFEVPINVETYFHRIGRAGRYGSRGCAITLAVRDMDDRRFYSIGSQGDFKCNYFSFDNEIVPANLSVDEDYYQRQERIDFPKMVKISKKSKFKSPSLANGINSDPDDIFGSTSVNLDDVETQFFETKNLDAKDSCQNYGERKSGQGENTRIDPFDPDVKDLLADLLAVDSKENIADCPRVYSREEFIDLRLDKEHFISEVPILRPSRKTRRQLKAFSRVQEFKKQKKNKKLYYMRGQMLEILDCMTNDQEKALIKEFNIQENILKKLDTFNILRPTPQSDQSQNGICTGGGTPQIIENEESEFVNVNGIRKENARPPQPETGRIYSRDIFSDIQESLRSTGLLKPELLRQNLGFKELPCYRHLPTASKNLPNAQFSSKDSKENQIRVEKRILVTSSKVGMVIGKGGSTVKKLIQKSGCETIFVNKFVWLSDGTKTSGPSKTPEDEKKQVVLRGTESAIEQARSMISRIVREEPIVIEQKEIPVLETDRKEMEKSRDSPESSSGSELIYYGPKQEVSYPNPASTLDEKSQKNISVPSSNQQIKKASNQIVPTTNKTPSLEELLEFDEHWQKTLRFLECALELKCDSQTQTESKQVSSLSFGVQTEVPFEDPKNMVETRDIGTSPDPEPDLVDSDRGSQRSLLEKLQCEIPDVNFWDRYFEMDRYIRYMIRPKSGENNF